MPLLEGVVTVSRLAKEKRRPNDCRCAPHRAARAKSRREIESYSCLYYTHPCNARSIAAQSAQGAAVSSPRSPKALKPPLLAALGIHAGLDSKMIFYAIETAQATCLRADGFPKNGYR